MFKNVIDLVTATTNLVMIFIFILCSSSYLVTCSCVAKGIHLDVFLSPPHLFLATSCKHTPISFTISVCSRVLPSWFPWTLMLVSFAKMFWQVWLKSEKSNHQYTWVISYTSIQCKWPSVYEEWTIFLRIFVRDKVNRHFMSRTFYP
jgi:hypothetical protein